jgi:hypothetical protein
MVADSFLKQKYKGRFIFRIFSLDSAALREILIDRIYNFSCHQHPGGIRRCLDAGTDRRRLGIGNGNLGRTTGFGHAFRGNGLEVFDPHHIQGRWTETDHFFITQPLMP